MTDLFTAIAVFIVSHAIPAVKPLRAYLIRALGFKMYVAMYSLMSVGVLVWLGFAYADAPYEEVWEFEEWMRWVTIILMLPSCLLMTVGLMSPNPLSLSLVSPDGYDPERPGIVGLMRHPVIWSIGLWAIAHMAPNGDVASLAMFTLLLLAGLTGPKSIDAKRRMKLGEEEWLALASPRRTLLGINGKALIAGCVLYTALFQAHIWVIGVPPLPY